MRLYDYIYYPDKLNENIKELERMIEEIRIAVQTPSSPKLSDMPRAKGYKPKDLLLSLYKQEDLNEKIKKLKILKYQYNKDILNSLTKIKSTNSEKVYIYLRYKQEIPCVLSRDISGLTINESKAIKHKIYKHIYDSDNNKNTKE